MRRFKTIVFLTFLILLFLSATVFSQTKEGETALAAKQTSSGELELVKFVSDNEAASVYIKLNNKTIKKLNYESAYIEQSYPQGSPKIFLIGLSTESPVCAVKFVILDLSKGNPNVTEEFGNCGDAPKLGYRNQSLTLDFPAGERGSKYATGKKQIWTYRNGRLKKLK